MINDNEEEEYFIDFDGEAEIEEEVNEQNIVRSFQKLRKQCDHWYQHLKRLPLFAADDGYWQVCYEKAFSSFTRIWKLQQEHRRILESRSTLNRTQIGQIASRIGQLYYHYYGTRSYLVEARGFYQFILDRGYFVDNHNQASLIAGRRALCDLFLGQLRKKDITATSALERNVHEFWDVFVGLIGDGDTTTTTTITTITGNIQGPPLIVATRGDFGGSKGVGEVTIPAYLLIRHWETQFKTTRRMVLLHPDDDKDINGYREFYCKLANCIGAFQLAQSSPSPSSSSLPLFVYLGNPSEQTVRLVLQMSRVLSMQIVIESSGGSFDDPRSSGHLADLNSDEKGRMRSSCVCQVCWPDRSFEGLLALAIYAPKEAIQRLHRLTKHQTLHDSSTPPIDAFKRIVWFTQHMPSYEVFISHHH